MQTGLRNCEELWVQVEKKKIIAGEMKESELLEINAMRDGRLYDYYQDIGFDSNRIK